MSAPSAPFFPTGPSSCWRRRVRRIARVGTVVGLLLLLPACSHTRKTKLDDVGLSYTPRNIGGVARWPAEVQRVAVLPVADATGSLPTTFVTSYDPTWLNALQHTQRAEFVAVDRAAYSRWTNHPRALVSTGPRASFRQPAPMPRSCSISPTVRRIRPSLLASAPSW
jgi:hypothetical protein